MPGLMEPMLCLSLNQDAHQEEVKMDSLGVLGISNKTMKIAIIRITALPHGFLKGTVKRI